jgi:hypothetical protein
MTEYRIKWCACPHVQHSPRLLFIEAETVEDAKAIARNHIERKFDVEWFTIQDVAETKPVPPGHVVER